MGKSQIWLVVRASQTDRDRLYLCQFVEPLAASHFIVKLQVDETAVYLIIIIDI